MKRALIDTNVIMDIACFRQPFFDDSSAIFEMIDENRLQGYLTATIVTDIFYLLNKDIGQQKTLDFLKELLNILEVLAVDKEIILKALYSGTADFEDAVQTQTALHNNLDLIITRNSKDFEQFKALRVLTPRELIEEIE